MRLIVALALVPILAAQAQRDRVIAQHEAAVSEHPDSAPDRERLISLYFGAPNAPLEPLSRDARRRHILWLIENRPDWMGLQATFADLELDGIKADPEGRADAERLWRDQISKPDLPPKALANAAWFFKFSDRAQARSLLSRGTRDIAISRVQGILAVLDWFGATAFDGSGNISRAQPSSRNLHALEQIDASNDAALSGGAGEFLISQMGLVIRTIGDPAAVADLAEPWLAKARALEPTNQKWSASLVEVYRRQANAAADPRAKVQLLSKAVEMTNGNQRLRMLAALADAEFQAADDSAAERDANELLQSSDADGVFAAHTLLGRLALDHGDTESAKKHLLDSARSKGSPVLGSFGPKMTLAQDLLDRGERDAVVQYLELCRAFWKNDRGFIDHFQPIVQKGGKPDLLAFYNPNRGQISIPKLPAPVLIGGAHPRWKPVPGAESYVVEWDVRKDGRWMSEPDEGLRVIPTRETSTSIDYTGPYRWRVFAVGRTSRGTSSDWHVVE